MLNQKDKINLYEVTNLVLTYTRNKFVYELDRLKKLIKTLEDG